MTETAHELVARGAALLDERLPGWADQIDIDSLKMSDDCNCVLGQLGKKQVNLDAHDETERDQQWEALRDAWKGEIVARRTL